MPFTYPNGHPFSPYYYAAQYGDNFTDFGYTMWFLGTGNANWFYGDDGADIMWGFKGEDWLYGGGGFDVMYGGDGDDRLGGGDAPDHLFGGADDDDISGEEGSDVLHGDDGNDDIYGGPGNDIIFGDDDEDFLNGHSGTDVINGGPGFDRIAGGTNGANGDVLTGGAQADWFFFYENDSGIGRSGIDRVTDFDQNGDDVLFFHADGVGSYDVALNTFMPELGYGTVVWAYDDGFVENIVFLEGVDPLTVTTDDISFFLI